MNKEIKSIKPSGLIFEISNLQDEGATLIQIASNRVARGRTRLSYIFLKEAELVILTCEIRKDGTVESIDRIYPSAAGFEGAIDKTAELSFLHRTKVKENDSPRMGAMAKGKIKPRDAVAALSKATAAGSFGSRWGLCAAIEKLMGIKVPERAENLRTIVMELTRIESHLLWLALLADEEGMEGLFSRGMQLRESILDILEEHAGGRIIQKSCHIGGMGKDIDAAALNNIVEKLQEMRNPLRKYGDGFVEYFPMKKRLQGNNVISSEEAKAIGLTGPDGRASGIPIDMRLNSPVGVYKELEFQPIVLKGGDLYTRALVRLDEIFQSISLIEGAVLTIPEGNIKVETPENLSGQTVILMELPEGMGIYIVEGDEKKQIKSLMAGFPQDIKIPV